MDSCSKAEYNWPDYKDAPSARDKALWQKALRLSFTGGICSSMNLLRQYMLGRWKYNLKDHIKWWKHDNGRVYSQINDTWQERTIALQQRITRARGGRRFRLVGDTVHQHYDDMHQVYVAEIGIDRIHITSEMLYRLLPAHRH